MKIKKILSVLLIVVMFLTIINIPTITKAEYKADKEWSNTKVGDVIYFDNTGLTDWDEVYIHLWYKSDLAGGNASNGTQWPGDKMEKVSEHLYKYTIDSSRTGNNMLIFNNNKGNGQNQTIDLGFIESGFVYRVDGTGDDNKRIGYWYLYDKSDILSHLERVKKYQADKEYYTKDSYNNLDELILKAAEEAKEIRLEMERNAGGVHTGKYYLSIGPLLNQIDDLVSGLQVNKEPLENKIQEQENNMDDYTEKNTPDSVKNLKDELDAAKEKLNDPDITVEDVKKEIADIDNAVNDLKPKADKEKLKELLNQAKDIDENVYTDDSVNNLKDKVEPAQTVYDNENATQEQVDEQVKNLQDAIDALKKKVDKSKLKEVLDESADIDESIYTEDSVNNLKDKVGPAQTVYENEDATQEQVDEQVKILRDAIDTLKKKESSANANNQNVSNNNTNNTNNTLTPKTGDSILIYIVISILAISIIVITNIYIKRRKQTKP